MLQEIVVVGIKLFVDDCMTQEQISQKQCVEKYCSCSKACQLSVLQDIHCRSYLEKQANDDKMYTSEYDFSQIKRHASLFLQNNVLRRKEI